MVAMVDVELVLRVRVPEQNLEKLLCFKALHPVWYAKNEVLDKLAKGVVGASNYGLYIPGKQGKAGKFLEDDRLLSSYRLEANDTLHFKEKKKVYLSSFEPKALAKINSADSRKRFINYINKRKWPDVSDFIDRGIDPNFIVEATGETPLTMVSALGFPNVVKKLVDAGAFTDFYNAKGLAAIHVAVTADQCDVIEQLFDLGVSPDARDITGVTPIYHAAMKGQHKCADLLLQEMAMVNVVGKDCWTELHHAAKLDNPYVLEMLLFHGSNVHARNSAGNTPFHVSVIENKTLCVRMLLKRGVQCDERNSAGHTPSENAAMFGNNTMVQIIRSFSPDDVQPFVGQPNFTNRARSRAKRLEMEAAAVTNSATGSSNATYAMDPVVAVESPKMKKPPMSKIPSNMDVNSTAELLSRRANDSQGEVLDPPIFIKVSVPELRVEKVMQFYNSNSIWYAREKVMQKLAPDFAIRTNYSLFRTKNGDQEAEFLEDERDVAYYALNPAHKIHLIPKRKIAYIDKKVWEKVNTSSHQKKFMEFVTKRDHKKMDKLMSDGLDPNFIWSLEGGLTPLTKAVSLVDIKIITTLVKGGAFLSYRDASGSTGFHVAANRGLENMVEAMIELGGSPNYRDHDGLTVLYHICSSTSHSATRMAKLLLKHGAELNRCDSLNFTELHQSSKLGKFDLVELLLEYGANVNACTTYGDTPLHLCALYNQISTARLILHHRADTRIQNSTGKLPSDIALEAGNKDVYDTILQFDKEIGISPGQPVDYAQVSSQPPDNLPSLPSIPQSDQYAVPVQDEFSDYSQTNSNSGIYQQYSNVPPPPPLDESGGYSYLSRQPAPPPLHSDFMASDIPPPPPPHLEYDGMMDVIPPPPPPL